MNLLEPAQLVRWIGADEATVDLVEEAKALTWESEAEHALLVDDSNRRLLVQGGRDGISFTWNARRQVLEMEYDGSILEITKILWHTHPRVTGPSDGDLEALTLLGQSESIIYELGGHRDGTRIRPKV